MKKFVDDLRLIYKCCRLYYQEEKGQQEICETLGISRPSVSRMLKMGRKMGIVRIEVIDPETHTYSHLEQQLEQAFGLKEAIVVCSCQQQSGVEMVNTALGSAALAYLSRILRNGWYVGVSMGLTLQQTVRAEYGPITPVHCTFIPLVGGVGEGVETHANFLAGEFARRFGGERLQLYSPAIFSDPAVLAGFRKERAVRQIFALYPKLDAAVFGIGTLDISRSTAVRLNYVRKETLEAFAAGAVGDISLQYYDQTGRTRPYAAYNERVAGLQLSELVKVPLRLAIAGGAAKAAAVAGALRGSFVNVLITDEACASAVLQLVDVRP